MCECVCACVCVRVFLDVHVCMCVYTMEPLNAQCVMVHQLNIYQLVVVQRFDPPTQGSVSVLYLQTTILSWSWVSRHQSDL